MRNMVRTTATDECGALKRVGPCSEYAEEHCDAR